MATVTKTWDDLPEVDEQELHQRWQQATPGDPDEEFALDDPSQWEQISLDDLVGKTKINLRLDKDVVAYFKRRAKGRGYQSDINKVLKGYVKAQRQKEYHY